MEDTVHGKDGIDHITDKLQSKSLELTYVSICNFRRK
jgi:hypothetical protein